MRSEDLYTETVFRARRLRTQYSRKREKDSFKYKFALGDLSLEAVPLQEQDDNSRDTCSQLVKWYGEAQIEFSYVTFQTIRYVSNSWPEPLRCVGASWSVHRVLHTHPDRFDIIKPDMTVAEAMAIMKYDDEGRDLKSRMIVKGFRGVMKSGEDARSLMGTFNRKLRDIDLDDTQREEVRHVLREWERQIEIAEMLIDAPPFEEVDRNAS